MTLVKEVIGKKVMDIKQVLRGEVYKCHLKEGIGSEQTKDRPVVIIQNDTGNLFSPTTIVAVISTKPKKRDYPMHVKVAKGAGGLLEDSEIFLEQIETIDKTRLYEYIGTFNESDEIMQKINAAIRVSLGL
jgi:mRNA interferase MazF